MTKSTGPEEFEDAELKHLEFIQGIIARLAQNSFLLKGWSVTLVAGILALASRNPSIYVVVIAILPALAFWGLDAFYLGQERNLRDLYNDARERKIMVLDIAPEEYETGPVGWMKSLFARSVWPLHVAVVVTVVVVGWMVGRSAW